MTNNQVTIAEEAYLLTPFKKIWNRDKTKDKANALCEMAYIYFMEDFKSDFADIVNEEDREIEVKGSVSLPPTWKEDIVVKEAREFYRKRSEEITPLLLLRDAKIVIDKMREFYRKVDFLELDKNGKPLYDIDKVARVIERSAGILENMTKLENMVKKEVQSKKDKIGTKTKSTFEDGI